MSRIQVFGRLLMAGVFLTAASGCTSLTQSDEVRVSKDRPKTKADLAAEAEAQAAAMARSANQLQEAMGNQGEREPLQAAPAAKGG